MDHARLEQLVLQLGAQRADQVVSHAMEELAVTLARIEKHNRVGRFEDVRAGIHGLQVIARQVGMTGLNAVCRDALDLIDRHDSPAWGAVLARLVRLGEESLVAVWDLQDVTV